MAKTTTNRDLDVDTFVTKTNRKTKKTNKEWIRKSFLRKDISSMENATEDHFEDVFRPLPRRLIRNQECQGREKLVPNFTTNKD